MGMVSSLCLEKWSSEEVLGRDNGCNIYLMIFIANPTFSQDMVCVVDLQLNNGIDTFPLPSCLDDISCEDARFPLLKITTASSLLHCWHSSLLVTSFSRSKKRCYYRKLVTKSVKCNIFIDFVTSQFRRKKVLSDRWYFDLVNILR